MLSREGDHFPPRLPERGSGRAEGAHERLMRGGVDDRVGVGNLDGGGDLGEVVDVEGGGRGAAEAVSRVVGGALGAGGAREDVQEGGEAVGDGAMEEEALLMHQPRLPTPISVRTQPSPLRLVTIPIFIREN